ncbi:LCP family protein [Kitasatospora camelliae]|uniref:LCP family protein n=1 Tax=Kitasatospora camelliae TaxID=3156397 RepID=A0AAU8K1H2_9ACTN
MAGPRKVRSRRARVVRIAVLTLAGLLLAGLATAGLAYWKLNGNLKSVDIDGQLGSARPPASTDGSFNLLVLGSDSRAGDNRNLAGGASGGTARSDTAMVVHVSQDHARAAVVSVPRDTLVARPACTGPDGKTVPAARGVMYNSAFEVGGPACAVATAEQLTGMRMDHFVEIDFAGFAGLIDALGGVDVTTTVPIDDQDSGLHLSAGAHHLGGAEALAFVRTRHGVGDGSDLGRIELQKQMIRSIMTRVGSLGLTSNPTRFWPVADRLTRSITTDSDLASVSSLVGLASTLRGIGPQQLTMVTLPVATAPGDPNRVVERNPDAARLWAALRTDQAVPQAVVTAQPSNPAQAAGSPSGRPSPGPSAGPAGAAASRTPTAAPTATGAVARTPGATETGGRGAE